MTVGNQSHLPAALTSGKRLGNHCTGGWVGPRAGLNGCGKSRPHRDSQNIKIFDKDAFKAQCDRGNTRIKIHSNYLFLL
jgi:hypothetical protein